MNLSDHYTCTQVPKLKLDTPFIENQITSVDMMFYSSNTLYLYYEKGAPVLLKTQINGGSGWKAKKKNRKINDKMFSIRFNMCFAPSIS